MEQTATAEATKETTLPIRLNEGDRENIGTIIGIFEKMCREKRLDGECRLVGSILEHPIKANDIDILVSFKGKAGKIHASKYQLAMDSFSILKELAERAISKSELKIKEEIPPAIDETFGNFSILKHDGKIKLEKPGAKSIDLVNDTGGFVSYERKSHVIARVNYG